MEQEVIEEKKPKRYKYVLSILFMLALLVATIIVLFNKYDINNVWSVLKKLNIWLILGAVALIFVYILFEGLAMKIILHALGINVSVANNFVYSAIDYYFCAVTPSATGGQPMVAYYMTKDNVPITQTSLVLLINTALFKIVLLTLSVIAIIACPQYVFYNWLTITLYFLGFVINVFLIVMCFLGAFKRKWIEAAGKRVIMLLHKWHIVKKPISTMRTFIQKMEEYEEGAKLIKYHKKHFALALLANFIQRVAMFSMAFFVFVAFNQAYPMLHDSSYIELLSLQVIIALSVDSLPLPGGVGISEFLYVLLMGMVYGGEDMVGTAMMVTRSVSFYIPVIITMLIFMGKHLRVTFRHKREKKIS